MTDAKRTRMFDSEEPQNPSPRTTIVGGRPPDPRPDLPPVPNGLQPLLRLAAVDDGFAAELVTRRSALAEQAGVALTANERAILDAVPAAQLTAMAHNLPPPAPDRRDFLRETARTAVVALGGVVLASASAACPVTRGITPDEPPPPTRGISPDVPPPRPRFDEPAPPTGHAPDVPPPRPDEREMNTEGGAAPDEPPPRHDDSMRVGGIRPDPIKKKR